MQSAQSYIFVFLLMLTSCAHGPISNVAQNRITGTYFQNFSKKNVSLSELALHEHSVLWGSANGNVFRVSAITLEKRWKTSIKEAVTTKVFVLNDRAYVGTRKGSVYCLDFETGAIRWKKNYDTSIRGQFVSFQNHIFFIGLDGQMLGIDQDTGDIGFQKRFFVPDSFTLTYEMIATKNGTNLLVALPSDEVLALDAELKTLWQYQAPLANAASLIHAIVSINELSDGRLLVTPYMNDPFVLNSSGTVEYTLSNVQTSSAPLIHASSIIYATQKGVVLIDAQNLTSGEPLPYQSHYPIAGLAKIENLLFIATTDGSFDVYDLDAQKKMWTYITSAPLKGAPIRYNNDLLMLNQRGQLFSFRAPYRDDQGRIINP